MTELNRLLERFNVLMLPLLMIVGMLLHRYLNGFSVVVPYVFMFLTMVSSMAIKKQDILSMVRNSRPALIILFVSHALFPCLVYMVLQVIELDRSLQQGIILALIMPVGITSVAWVTLARGNVGTAISMVSLSTALAPLLVPATLLLLAGEKIEMDQAGLMKGLVTLVLLPCLAGLLLGSVVPPRSTGVQSALSMSSKLSLYFIILINAASVFDAFGQIGGQIVQTAAMIGALVMSGYLVSWVVLYLLKIESALEIAYTYSGGVRNYTAALVLAQLYFPSAVAVPVMIAVLLQHPTALLAHTLLTFRFRHVKADKCVAER